MSLLDDMDAALAAPVRPVAGPDAWGDFVALFAPVPVLPEERPDRLVPVPFGRPRARPAAAEPLPPDDPALPAVALRQQLARRAALTAGHGVEGERMEWPDRWWDGFDCADAAACRALWGAALAVCIGDALRHVAGLAPMVGSQSAAPASWLGSRDFHMMAALAGLDGVALAERLAPALADPAQAAALARRLRGLSGGAEAE